MTRKICRYVIDTNVPIVANGRGNPSREKLPALECREAAVNFLINLLMGSSAKLVLDTGGAIQAEYHRHLHPRGQPGVGDRFYLAVLQSAPRLVERVDLPKRDDGEYVDMPQTLIDLGFDPSDRKFAALARRETIPVVNATDSDWVNHYSELSFSGIDVKFLCGCDTEMWFTT